MIHARPEGKHPALREPRIPIDGTPTYGGQMRDRTPVQSLAMIVGATFLLVGILGFIPGIMTNYSDMTFAGHDSGAQLLGIFQVSILHNIVHILFGIVGIVLAKSPDTARTFLIGGGVVYLALWLLGI